MGLYDMNFCKHEDKWNNVKWISILTPDQFPLLEGLRRVLIDLVLMTNLRTNQEKKVTSSKSTCQIQLEMKKLCYLLEKSPLTLALRVQLLGFKH